MCALRYAMLCRVFAINSKAMQREAKIDNKECANLKSTNTWAPWKHNERGARARTLRVLVEMHKLFEYTHCRDSALFVISSFVYTLSQCAQTHTHTPFGCALELYLLATDRPIDRSSLYLFVCCFVLFCLPSQCNCCYSNRVVIAFRFIRFRSQFRSVAWRIDSFPFFEWTSQQNAKTHSPHCFHSVHALRGFEFTCISLSFARMQRVLMGRGGHKLVVGRWKTLVSLEESWFFGFDAN